LIDEVRLDRYKLAIQVVMGEIKGQGLRITSKCLWDPNFDNWASYTFSNVINDLKLLNYTGKILCNWNGLRNLF
jgi:Tctex-1 family.